MRQAANEFLTGVAVDTKSNSELLDCFVRLHPLNNNNTWPGQLIISWLETDNLRPPSNDGLVDTSCISLTTNLI